MAKNITDWLPDVYAEIGGNDCPPSKIETAIVESIRDFCDKTLTWKVNLDRISVVADTQSYALTIATSDIISIMSVKYKQNGLGDDQFGTLTPITEQDNDVYKQGSWEFLTSSSPSEFWVDSGRTLNLWPTPTDASTEGLLVKVFVKPLVTATEVEDFFYNDHKKAVTLGAVSKLLQETNTPWANIEVGLLKERQYITMCNDAIRIKKTGYTNKPLSVKFRRFV